jgi:hypothetical protein
MPLELLDVAGAVGQDASIDIREIGDLDIVAPCETLDQVPARAHRSRDRSVRAVGPRSVVPSTGRAPPGDGR